MNEIILPSDFPELKGFSARNLKYMRKFADVWPEPEFVQEVLAQLPWYHQIALMDKLKTTEERRWYATRAIEHGWSRNVLVHQIETRLLDRQGSAVSNFSATLAGAAVRIGAANLQRSLCIRLSQPRD